MRVNKLEQLLETSITEGNLGTRITNKLNPANHGTNKVRGERTDEARKVKGLEEPKSSEG